MEICSWPSRARSPRSAACRRSSSGTVNCSPAPSSTTRRVPSSLTPTSRRSSMAGSLPLRAPGRRPIAHDRAAGLARRQPGPAGPCRERREHAGDGRDDVRVRGAVQVDEPPGQRRPDADAQHDPRARQRQPLGQPGHRRQRLDQPERADQRRGDHEPGDEREHRRGPGSTGRTGSSAPSAGPARPARTSCRDWGVVGCTSAYAMPATMLPAALSARRTPVAPGCPRWCANAIVMTSNDPKTPPSITMTATTARTPGTDSADGSAAVRRARPAAARSVAARAAARCRRRAGRPSRAWPAPDPTASATHVTSGGPSTKMTSSRIDSSENAVCRPGVPDSACAHRARTNAPVFGKDAPATAPVTNSVQAAASRVASQAKSAERQRADHDHRRHGARLAVAVDEPGQERLPDRLRERRHRGDGAGEAVATRAGGHQQHDGDAEHRDRQPGQERRRRERRTPPHVQQDAVRVLHVPNLAGRMDR